MERVKMLDRIELYKQLLIWLYEKANATNIKTDDLEKYFIPEIEYYKDNYLIRLASSLQNGTSGGMDKVIKFNAENNHLIKEIICNGNIDEARMKYSCWQDIYSKFIDNGIKDNGINVREKKKSEGKKADYSTSWEKYSKGLYDGIIYLSNGGREAITQLCKNPNCEQSLEEKIKIINQFDRKNEIIGLGLALVCDWLKECGSYWLAKPDIHIAKVYRVLNGLDETKKSTNEELKVIKYMYDWADEIKNSGIDDNMTAYKLDKIIWLICTGEFYLHKNRTIGRNTIINFIKGEDK